MGNLNVNQIELIPLATIPTAGGDVRRILKKTDRGYSEFGEAYFTFIDCGFVKAWKSHQIMQMNLVVAVGKVRFVFYDGMQFREEIIGQTNYSRLCVPPKVWFGFQGLDVGSNLVINISNILHDPDESDRVAVEAITYDWKMK